MNRQNQLDTLLAALARAAYEHMRAAGPVTLPQQPDTPPAVPQRLPAA